jgi:hypothetical protein
MSPIQILVLVVGVIGAQAIMWAALSIRMTREIERLARSLRDEAAPTPNRTRDGAAPSGRRQNERLASGAAVVGAAIVVVGVLLESTCNGAHVGCAVLTIGLCLELGLALARFCADFETPRVAVTTRRGP